MLAEQVAKVERLHAAAREDRPDGVHAMRVATRRLRSALASGRPFLDRGVTDPLRDELGWLADSLGAARDAEVRIERLSGALEELVAERDDIDWRIAEVEPAFLDPLRLRHAEAHAALSRDLDSGRYADLAARLYALLAEPPWTPRAAVSIHDAYRSRVRRELRKLDKRMRGSGDPDLDHDERAAALHDARKAVKRTRYALAPLRALYGKRAKRLSRRLQDLQACLGLLQDTVITREYLADLVYRPLPSVPPSVAVVAGALIEREATHAETHERDAQQAWAAVMASRFPE